MGPLLDPIYVKRTTLTIENYERKVKTLRDLIFLRASFWVSFWCGYFDARARNPTTALRKIYTPVNNG